MKWKTKNRIINEIGNLCDKTKGRIFEVWKSIIINFSNTYNICSTLCTLNGMKARKTKYCVIRIETIIPSLDLKNLSLLTIGNFFLIIVCPAI